jgi:hypothetical protein
VPASHRLVSHGLGRLVDVHHHGPLEVRHGAGYCVQTLEPSHVAGQWRKLSPSAEPMVDPECGARCAIRDTGAPGEGRYHWTGTVLDETDPVAAGRTGELGQARSQAEVALHAYVEGGDWPSGGGIGGNGYRITGAALLARARRIRLLADAGEAVGR